MRIGIVSLFPEIFGPFLKFGVLGRGIDSGLIKIDFWNPRDFSDDPNNAVDDKPYGGGPGVVMKAQPIFSAIEAAKKEQGTDLHVVYLSPQGKTLNQAVLKRVLVKRNILLVCGRYEGVDERLIESVVDEQISIGDYVLSGGEIAAMVVTDGLSRFVPGLLGGETSADNDSFSDGLLEYPQYTRPQIWAGRSVPSILLSGNHQKIADWRKSMAINRTSKSRPDLLKKRILTEKEQEMLKKNIEVSNESRIDR
ncbi:tRNA (guanosine(37)-N1)-methyltransferase TrmD [Gammaproteobacteria bacterium]|nr:tRNA (guanosine(37)-N1)-methyltransferase TrmD [Gammaproteobacteria bacterium]